MPGRGGVISRPGLRRLAHFAIVAASLFAALPAYAAEEKAPSAEPEIKGPTFVRLPAIVLPVVVGNEITRQIGVNLALELEDGKTADDLGPNKRRVVDAFIRDLYGIYDQRRNATRALDYSLIKERLKDTATKIVGPGLIKEVLILQAYEHRQ